MKYIKLVFSIIIIIIIYSFSILILTNNKENSIIEGRTYVSFPGFKINKLLNDDYLNQITNAFSDQIPFRESLVKLYYLFQFQRYYGDVVEGKDNQLFAKPLVIENIDKRKIQLERVVDYINKQANTADDLGAKFIYLSIPRKDAIMTKYLPSTYTSSENYYMELSSVIKSNINDKVIYLDAYELFKDEDVNYFFQTDHHINIRGAQKIYESLMGIMKEDIIPLDAYIIKKSVVNGSFNRQIGQRIQGSSEELFISLKNKDFNYDRLDNGVTSKASIWGQNGSQYENAYMNGDYGETVVETSNKDKPNILYVGSSYTNILEVLTIPNSYYMVSIDYRHNETGKSINDYIKEYNIDYVIYLPAQSNSAFSISMMKQHLGL